MEVRRNNNRGNNGGNGGNGNNNMRNRNNNRGGSSGGGRFNNNGRRGGRSGFGEQAVPDKRQLRRAQELRDKHNYMAQDALKSGDRITAEYHFQHADHFFRVAAEIELALAEFESSRPQRWSEHSAPAPASNAFDGEIPAFLEGGYNSAQSNENPDSLEQADQKQSQPEDQPSTPNSQYGRPQRRYGRYSKSTNANTDSQASQQPPTENHDEAY